MGTRQSLVLVHAWWGLLDVSGDSTYVKICGGSYAGSVVRVLFTEVSDGCFFFSVIHREEVSVSRLFFWPLKLGSAIWHDGGDDGGVGARFC